ncbi:MAG: LuxR family transcriptional regulator [Frankiales bacterium]|nr:LuxR family transcriptional regulator [Frankiales bacterium]
MTLRVLIVDDHPVFRSGLRGAVAAVAGAELVGEADNGAQAIALAQDCRPDVVLMDLQMDGISGVEATRRIRALLPDVAVLVLTMSDDDESVFAAVRAGASGYLLKGVGESEITAAIAAVARGEAVFGAGVARRLLDTVAGRSAAVPIPFPELTGREQQVLSLLASGVGNAGIASRLTVSPKTVRNTVSTILSKLNAVDRDEAIARARAAGLGA